MSGPPEAPRRPHEHLQHGVTRSDPYYWMRDAGAPDVVASLAAERAWYDASVGHLASLVEQLQSEMVGRTPATDVSVRARCRHFSYYTQLPAGSDHRQLLRDLNSLEADVSPDPELAAMFDDGFGGSGQVLLDMAELTGGSTFVELGVCPVSPDERLLAYSYDLDGDEVYRLRFRDLTTGADLEDDIPRSYYGSAWSAGSDEFFYTVHDRSYRPFQVRRHRLGTPVSDDVVVLEEPDPRFELNVRRTRSGQVVIWSVSSDTTEVWFLDADNPTGIPRSVGGRRSGVVYHAEHTVLVDGSEVLLVLTNDGAPEFRLMVAPIPRQAHQDHMDWRELVPGTATERLERIDAFAGFAVLTLRTEGERRLRILPLSAVESASSSPGAVDVLPMFPVGTVHLGPNPLFDSDTILVGDGSYVHPTVWSDLDPLTGARRERQRDQAPGHDPARYVCQRLEFQARDGVLVPATAVRHRDTPLDGTAPALLYGYGAYEAVDEPEWQATLPCLLDRGVVFVHAHVRGGGEGGRAWYLDGRLDRKQNTFSDHVAVADGLAAAGLVDGERLATRGLSAGGLLQAAVFDQRPDRWRAVIAEVPFVDVVTSMLDPDVPLTAQEWSEWGDPRRAADFEWLLAYSPYENPPPPGGRPDLLVTGAVHDPRVMVSEPAKWVAMLRHTDPAWSPRCLFRVETGAGAHTGPSGRYAHLHYEAEVLAWVLDKLFGE